MAHSTFAERFGFSRWLRHLEVGEAPGFAEIGRAIERTGQAVSGYAGDENPPVDYRTHAEMAAFFGVDERWLIRDQGEPPRPDLWEIWLRARRKPDARPTYVRAAERHGLKVAEGSDPMAALAAKKKKAKAAKKRPA